MSKAVRRVALVAGPAMILGSALAAPAPAQQTTETTITYAAESASAGIYLAITPPGEEEPAAAISGAATEGNITSDGPAAAGQADVLAVLGESPAQATTSAPPDASDSVTSPIPEIEVPGVATIGILQGEASSASEATDGLPSTENDASFSGAEIDLIGPELGPLGLVTGAVDIAAATTFADAGASAETDVEGAAGSSGLAIGLDLNIEILSQVCANLPEGPLQDACNSLAEQEGPVVANISLGTSDVSCAWDGESADCDGNAALAVIELLGQSPIEVSPGETVTLPPEGPFLIRVSAGSFSEEVSDDPDSGSAIATGISVELLGQDPNLPGLVTLALGQSTAGVSGAVDVEKVIPRTGGPVLPILLGGSALVAAGLGLRRYLKRR
jgi:hypothetical protein